MFMLKILLKCVAAKSLEIPYKIFRKFSGSVFCLMEMCLIYVFKSALFLNLYGIKADGIKADIFKRKMHWFIG